LILCTVIAEFSDITHLRFRVFENGSDVSIVKTTVAVEPEPA
jgi:hypothetical protein